MSNIPIYRAKKINSDKYVEGSLIQSRFIFKDWIDDVWTSFGETRSNKAEVYTIDTTTLSIHFPDMIDNQGNKIFASLREDGKGGDIVEYNGRQEIIKYSNGTIQTYMFRFEDLKELNFRAVKIQK